MLWVYNHNTVAANGDFQVLGLYVKYLANGKEYGHVYYLPSIRNQIQLIC